MSEILKCFATTTHIVPPQLKIPSFLAEVTFEKSPQINVNIFSS